MNLLSSSRRQVAALAILLAPALLSAQSTGTVSGRVLDAQGAPLQGASISLAGTNRGAIARSDGSYRLTAPAGRYEIRARLLGYTPRADSVTIRAGSDVTESFRLERAATSIEAVSVIGTRGEERTVISAPVPIDVLSSLEVRSTGRTETSQMIQALAPSFNFPRTTLGDATDNVRPATLRGLSPDQALVLVNGKRRHASAVVNINGFVGRGSEAVDLNAIPAGMIDHIEILRDGAAAQYGSDAIAGVINIVLKSTAPGDITAQAGEYSTKEPQVANFTTDTYKHDGKLFYANADHGWQFGQNGYVFLGGEVRDRGYTNRAAPDTRVQYFQNRQPTDPNLPVPGGIDFKIGDSYQHDDLGWLNAGTTFSNGAQLYAFGGLSHRFGDAFGFWRRPRDPTNLLTVYPNGYLPEEQPIVWDGSGYVGLKGQAAGWDYDLSTGYGRNVFDMNVVHSINVSLGAGSPRDFYAGQLAFGQWTTNLDVNRDFKLPIAPLHTAWGLEFRDDSYKVGAGDPASYAQDTSSYVLDSLGNKTSTPAPVGSQVYPGFRPQDAGSHSRNNVGGYVDLSSDLTSHLLVDVAGRYEHYSDFGGTTTGKVAARYELIHGVAFRGAVSSGFRAPSLGQEYFSNTAINFVGTPAQPLEIRTFPVSSPEAEALNAKPLRPEKSMNYSAGVALEPLRNASVTVDYYRIDLKDRIVLSNNFTSQAVVNALVAHGIVGVQGGRYFTNAVDSRTNGIDVIGNYGWSITRTALLRLTAAYNGNWTRVTRIDTTSIIPGQGNNLFSRVDQARLEKGNPRDNLVLSANLGLGRFGIDFRNQRFGQVTSYGTTTAGDQTWTPKWVSDLALSFGPVTRATVTLGADNIFNTYPDPTITANTNSGILPYSGIAPFGINGRFVYAKLSYGW
ncbi:MAG: TonB-dependent receptor [Gemmatimonadaceae bacterium]